MSEDDAFRPLGPQATYSSAYRGAVILPVDAEGRVLLQLRDHNPAAVHPGEWGFFGGEAETGETLAEAAAREFEEETGLIRPPAAFAPYVRIVSPVSKRLLFVFSLALDVGPAEIRLGEGAGFGFIEARDFAAMKIVPATRIVLASWIADRAERARRSP